MDPDQTAPRGLLLVLFNPWLLKNQTVKSCFQKQKKKKKLDEFLEGSNLFAKEKIHFLPFFPW